MASLGAWAAVATVVAAAVAIIALGGGALFRAGRHWERVQRLSDVTEQNQESIRELQVEVDRLWVARAEGAYIAEEGLPGSETEDTPLEPKLIPGEEDENHDAGP